MPRMNTQILGGFNTGMDRSSRRGGKDGAQRLWLLQNAYLNERGEAVPRPGLQHVANVANSRGLYGWQGQLHVFHGESDYVDPGNPLVAAHWVRYPYQVQPLTLTGALPSLRVGDFGTYQYVEAGGVAPYGALAVASGALPPWASMDATGLVTYTVTAPGSWAWSIGGTDADGVAVSLADATTVPSEILATWSTKYTGAAQHLYAAAVANGIILAVGDNGDVAYSLDQGATFTIVNPQLGGWVPYNAIKFNGDWYLISNNVTASRATGDTFVFAAMSNPPNAVQQTAVVLTSAAYPTGALYVGAYGTTNSNLLRMNTPGAAWTAIDTGFAYGNVVAICQAGNTYFVVCASGKILKSTDLVTFTLAYDTANVNVTSCAYLQPSNVLVVATSGGDVYRSTDMGLTWTYYAGQGVQYVTATRQEFLGARTFSVLKSTDGISWTTVYTNSSNGQQTTNFATDGTLAAVGRIDGRVDVGTP